MVLKRLVSRAPLGLILCAAVAVSSFASKANADPLEQVSLSQGPVTVDGNQIFGQADRDINLSEFLQALQQRPHTPTNIIVVADTITIDRGVLLSLNNQALYVFAREIVGAGSASLVINQQEGNQGLVALFADRMVNPILLVAQFADGTIDFRAVTNAAEGGQLWSLSGSEAQFHTADIDLGDVYNIAPTLFNHVLERSFDLAAERYESSREEGLTILTWAEENLRPLDDARASDTVLANLYLQVANLKQFIELAGDADAYVPVLDQQLYEDIYIDYLDTMELYQASYERFVDRGLDLETRISEAQQMLARMVDVQEAEDRTIQRSLNQVDSLEDAVRRMSNQFLLQRLATDSAELEFRLGINAYVAQQQINLVISVLETTASAGVALGSAAAGDVGALVELAASIPGTVQELQEIAQTIDDVGSLISKVDELDQVVQQLAGQLAVDVSHNALADALNLTDLVVPSREEANLVWDVFIATVKSELQPAIDEGIGGAREFLLALESLAIYGKAVTGAKISRIQELSRLVDLLIATKVTTNEITRLGQLLDSLAEDEQALSALEDGFRRQLYNLKRPLFVAVTKFIAAFRYWGLSDVSVVPSLDKPFEEYRLDLALLQEAYNDALAGFSPPPQDFTLRSFVINDPLQVETFLRTHALTVHIGLDSPTFGLFERVRLGTVRVFLEGEGLSSGDYFFDITSDGNYRDRLDEVQFAFSGEPITRRFGYGQDTDGEVDIITDGAVSDQFAFAYFEPTPFSTWTVELLNPEFHDLSGVEAIRFEFFGNGIPR